MSNFSVKLTYRGQVGTRIRSQPRCSFSPSMPPPFYQRGPWKEMSVCEEAGPGREGLAVEKSSGFGRQGRAHAWQEEGLWGGECVPGEYPLRADFLCFPCCGFRSI